MKKNYEIKCKLPVSKINFIAKSLEDFSHSTEKQTDIYYKVNSGRLKLRIISDSYANLIFYNRDEKTIKRISRYIISRTSDFSELDDILKKQFKVKVTVNKRREIFIKKNIRIHLDKVTSLGSYLEIEIIYENFSKAKLQMKELILRLDLDESSFIKESYSDLLINRR